MKHEYNSPDLRASQQPPERSPDSGLSIEIKIAGTWRWRLQRPVGLTLPPELPPL